MRYPHRTPTQFPPHLYVVGRDVPLLPPNASVVKKQRRHHRKLPSQNVLYGVSLCLSLLLLFCSVFLSSPGKVKARESRRTILIMRDLEWKEAPKQNSVILYAQRSPASATTSNKTVVSQRIASRQ